MLKTPRLLLRPFALSDAERFQALAGDWDVARMTSDIPYPLSVERALHWLQPATGEQRFAICLDGEVIGGAGTFRRDTGDGELGFWLGRAYWGHGYATEAARAVLAHGAATADYVAFSSSHFDDNPASRRVLEKLGFEPASIGQIWSEARGAAVGAHWVSLSLERARVLHGGAVPLASRPARLWAGLRDRFQRHG